MQTTNSFSMLRTAMRSNAAFSMLAAAAFIFAASPIAKYIGLDSSTILLIIGVVLIVWAAEIFISTRREDINRNFAQAVIALDLLWVIGSAIVFFSPSVPLTTAGKWFVAIQADFVLIFAVWQYFGLKNSK